MRLGRQRLHWRHVSDWPHVSERDAHQREKANTGKPVERCHQWSHRFTTPLLYDQTAAHVDRFAPV